MFKLLISNNWISGKNQKHQWFQTLNHQAYLRFHQDYLISGKGKRFTTV